MANSLGHSFRAGSCGKVIEISRLDAELSVIMLANALFLRKVSNSRIFLVLRDHTGLIQVLLQRQSLGDTLFDRMAKELETAGIESIIQVDGELQIRPEEATNEKMASGNYEVHGTGLRLLNKTENLPFAPFGTASLVRESLSH